jgi:hypothetical protein
MKRLFLALVVAATASLFVPLQASAAEYETFVGCDDLSENPIPSHVCQLGDFPGAYFESDVDVEVELCVEFPNAEELCTENEFAEGGVLYVYSIFSELEGNHLATWYVEGAEVGSWSFRLDPPPPPPSPLPAAPPAPAPAPAPPPAVATGPSPGCSKAKRRVRGLKKRLRNANGRKQKAKIRPKLRSARALERRAC